MNSMDSRVTVLLSVGVNLPALSRCRVSTKAQVLCLDTVTEQLKQVAIAVLSLDSALYDGSSANRYEHIGYSGKTKAVCMVQLGGKP